MNLSGFIARRYLFAKKSHNVINIISAISAAGIAVGCAALVIILSIYNGFDEIVRSLYNSYTPDLLITPAEGKAFQPVGEGFDKVRSMEGVASFCEVLEESVYLKYDEKHIVAVARGVDSVYQNATRLHDYIVEGSFELEFGALQEVVIGRTLALELGLHTRFLTPLEVYFPSRSTEVSLLDPMASLHKEVLYPAGIVSLEQGFDKKYVFMPVASLRNLLEYDNEVSSIEIYVDSTALDRSGIIKAGLQDDVCRALGDGFIVKNKQQQNDQIYKLLSYEKAAIYAILLFVMIIIACNIFGSLSMLIIEKKKDIGILRSMGAEDKLIKNIFVKEGWMISLLGIAAGVALGLLVCWIQKTFEIVKMPGNFIIDAYPVVVKFSDILIIIAGVALIGYLTAVISRAAGYSNSDLREE